MKSKLFNNAVLKFKKHYLIDHLSRNGWSILGASKELGVTRATIYKVLKQEKKVLKDKKRAALILKKLEKSGMQVKDLTSFQKVNSSNSGRLRVFDSNIKDTLQPVGLVRVKDPQQAALIKEEFNNWINEKEF